MTRAATAVLAALIVGGSLTALAIGDPGLPAMPDRSISPGAVASTDKNEICRRQGGLTYSQRHRQTTEAMKAAVRRAYGIAGRFRGEIDHIVPLCAGGADTLANLWPQTDYAAKDNLEASVCRDICHGKLSVIAGQAIFLGDWRGSLAAYPPKPHARAPLPR